jgi:hypothetical protein
MYFKGYFPIKVSIVTIAKINAAVEKLAGKIKINVIKTGIHNSMKDCWKVGCVSLDFDKYRATYTYNTIAANVDV